MSLRRMETWLARFTLCALAVFAVLETIASWQMLGGARGLIHPLYIGSLIGMVLMLVGAKHSLNARPRPAPGLLCASLAWMAATGWRATWSRIDVTSRGFELYYGVPELRATAGATALAFAALVLSLYLTYHATWARQETGGAQSRV